MVLSDDDMHQARLHQPTQLAKRVGLRRLSRHVVDEAHRRRPEPSPMGHVGILKQTTARVGPFGNGLCPVGARDLGCSKLMRPRSRGTSVLGRVPVVRREVPAERMGRNGALGW